MKRKIRMIKWLESLGALPPNPYCIRHTERSEVFQADLFGLSPLPASPLGRSDVCLCSFSKERRLGWGVYSNELLFSCFPLQGLCRAKQSSELFCEMVVGWGVNQSKYSNSPLSFDVAQLIPSPWERVRERVLLT